MLTTYGRFDALRSPCLGGCGREYQLEGVFGQGPEAGAIAAMSSSGSTMRSVMLGVGTGLSVWILTKVLDKYLFRRK